MLNVLLFYVCMFSIFGTSPFQDLQWPRPVSAVRSSKADLEQIVDWRNDVLLQYTHCVKHREYIAQDRSTLRWAKKLVRYQI